MVVSATLVVAEYFETQQDILGDVNLYLGAKTPLKAGIQGVIDAIHIPWDQRWQHI
ncbi:hypothetical protein TorRG33x02_316190 [Trema orientale]|uniref:Uncharacterized protein n=1 Tax=Trema orientale TaxID=63057 RepID=A0A2P5BM51_TREOI|nr:hypothetical protein TorRG33x02_316190 [Trema orientale]